MGHFFLDIQYISDVLGLTALEFPNIHNHPPVKLYFAWLPYLWFTLSVTWYLNRKLLFFIKSKETLRMVGFLEWRVVALSSNSNEHISKL